MVGDPVTDFGSTKITLVDLVADGCSLTHSNSPCAATRCDGCECYNTRTTCQDLANYTTSDVLHTFTFSQGAMVPGLNAWRTLETIRYSPGGIDRIKGLGARDKVTLTFTDHLSDDVGVDPYHYNRPSIQGYWWRKFLARNPSYQGWHLRIRTGYLDGLGYLDEGSMATKTVMLEQIKIGKRKRVTVVTRDLLKALERTLIPAPSDAELAVDMLEAATEGTLAEGHDLTDGPVTVRIGDEIMVGTLTGDELTSVARGQRGSTAEDHDAEDKVQLCREWTAAATDEVWYDLLTESGIPAAYIDQAGAAAESGKWLSIPHTVTLSEPTEADKLVRDLMQQTSSMTWMDLRSQLIRFRATHPRTPDQTGYAITDDTHLEGESVQVDPQEDKRLTRMSIYYGIKNWASDFEEVSSYARRQVFVDAGAEEAYGDERDDPKFGYWLPATASTEVKAAAFRLVASRRDAPKRITLQVTDRDTDSLLVGGDADLTTDEVVDVTGAPVLTECLVVQEQAPSDNSKSWTLVLEPTNLAGRWAFYQPNTITNTFATATTEEKRRAFYADASGLMSDGSEGYKYV